MNFKYSRKSLEESVYKQNEIEEDFTDYAKMLYVFDEVVNNAKLINIHEDKYIGTRRETPSLENVYVFMSAFKDGDRIIPVEFNVKEFKGTQDNKLYMAVTLGDIKMESDFTQTASNASKGIRRASPKSLSKVSIADIIKKVNPKAVCS